MFRLFLALALVVSVSGDCQTGQYSECDESIYECCDKAFQTSIGIDKICNGDLTSVNPGCVQDALDYAFYGSGADGVFTVCDAFSSFRMCVQPAYFSCTKRKFWLENNRELQTANFIEAVYSSLNFACGAGMDSFLRNEDCLVDTYDKKFSTLNKCSRDFLRNIRQDSKNACRYVNEFTGCYNLAFQSCNMESAWWSCEKTSNYAKGLVHGCDVNCSN